MSPPPPEPPPAPPPPDPPAEDELRGLRPEPVHDPSTDADLGHPPPDDPEVQVPQYPDFPSEPGVVVAMMTDAGDEPEPSRPRVIRRTPHLDAPSAISVVENEEIEVSVSVNTLPRRATEEGDDMIVEAPADVTTITVGVLLTTSEHFEVLGDQFQPLTIKLNRSRSDPVSFRLKLVKPTAGRTLAISALLVHEGRPCGTVVRRWAIDTSKGLAKAVRARRPAGEIRVHPGAAPSDLSVIITAPVNDGLHFVCTVITDLIPGYSPPQSADWALPDRAAEFVSGRLSDVIDPQKTKTQQRRSLVSAGYEFYDAAPEIFKQVLWDLIDAKRPPRTIFVASQEPTLPWELMIPNRQAADGTLVDRGPLGAEFAIGRWVRDQLIPPEQELIVESAFVVAPTYSGDRSLKATDEVALVVERLNGRKISPCSLDALDEYFGVNHASLIHFICHGSSTPDSDDAIYLDDDEELRASVVRALSGFKTLCAKTRPLIFLNSCETGKTVRSLMGGGGFPRTLGDIGARAIIAPLWPVDNEVANRVALELYQRALDQPTMSLAEILRDLRARAYDTTQPFEDTWGAYCFYGDPTTQMKVEVP
jgi:hypothetical protein